MIAGGRGDIMASKRRLRRKGCTGKIRHPAESEAAIHAKSLSKAEGEKMAWYKCKFCKGWHVGHRAKRR